jgi:hypothetical protein
MVDNLQNENKYLLENASKEVTVLTELIDQHVT